jgi:hypothetical protein
MSQPELAQPSPDRPGATQSAATQPGAEELGTLGSADPVALGLIPANVPGAFRAPRPPDDFDPRTASGRRWPATGCPGVGPPGDPPAVRALRERALATPWLAGSRMELRLVSRPGVTHVRGCARKRADDTVSSSRWSEGVLE